MPKGRILGIQFRELFRDGLFFESARHADTMAQRLSEGLKGSGIRFAADTESNQLFPILPNVLIESLKESFDFYVWEPHDDDHSIVRLVTSWATEEERVDAFINAISGG